MFNVNVLPVKIPHFVTGIVHVCFGVDALTYYVNNKTPVVRCFNRDYSYMSLIVS